MAVRHYQVTLTAVGPVHVGDGKSLGKKDYFRLDDKTLAVLDVPRFIGSLSEDELRDYCEFLEGSSSDERGELDYLLDRHRNLRAVAGRCTEYAVETPLAAAPRGQLKRYAVKQFVKDGHGSPYIPGSSVKGMLRTALLAHLISMDRDRYAGLYDPRMAQDRKGRTTACGRIERKALNRIGDGSGATSDIMRFVSVSDSEPLSTADLVFVKKYDKFSRDDHGRHKRDLGRLSRDKGYYEGNELNIYRECLRPGTVVRLTVDVDDRIDAHLDGLVLDQNGIISILKYSFDLYQERFLDAFELDAVLPAGSGGQGTSDDGRCRHVVASGPLAGSRCRNASVGGTGYCRTHQDEASKTAQNDAGEQVACVIGGGTDFDSKTLINALFEKAEESVSETAHILYSQFPTKVNRATHPALYDGVRAHGFNPVPFRGRGRQKKDDHRHWMDEELGVSPHTVKLGIVGGKQYPMGRCSIRIEETAR